MADVAREAGVSLMTVSRAYKSPDKVSQVTRKKIEAASAKLGYVPNLVAGNLASGRSRAVAAIIPSLRNSNYATMIQGLQDHLTANNYQLMLAVGDTPETEAEAVKSFLGRRPDGMVLTGREHSAETTALLMGGTLPVVEAWELEGPIIDMASGFSMFDAVQDITKHLIDLGHRTIGFAGYTMLGVRRFENRSIGFRTALQAAGLRDDLIYLEQGAGGFACGRRALEVLTSQEPRLSALVCATDVLAAGAILECYRRDWPIPKRLAISGLGDYEIASEIPGGLTTIKTHGYDIGASAADLIIQRLNGDKVDKKIRDVGYEIIIRGSTGAFTNSVFKSAQ
jgi:LacI family gluconate utilization system Gnt-I transcriptional repressor